MKHALGVGGDGDVGVSRGGEREPVGRRRARRVEDGAPAPAAGSRAHSRAASTAAHTMRRAMSSLTSRVSARSHRPRR